MNKTLRFKTDAWKCTSIPKFMFNEILACLTFHSELYHSKCATLLWLIRDIFPVEICLQVVLSKKLSPPSHPPKSRQYWRLNYRYNFFCFLSNNCWMQVDDRVHKSTKKSTKISLSDRGAFSFKINQLHFSELLFLSVMLLQYF